MIFLTAIFLALFSAGLFFFGELTGRRQRSVKPGSLKEFWVYAQKRTTPNLNYSGLIFAVMTLFVFQIWEAFLRFLLQREAHTLYVVLGLMMITIALALRLKRLYSRSENDLRLGSLTLVLMCAGFSALLNSWGTLFFVPWVWFRARFLPHRLG
jgi:nucleoside recognition membrane protein YjiH